MSIPDTAKVIQNFNPIVSSWTGGLLDGCTVTFSRLIKIGDAWKEHYLEYISDGQGYIQLQYGRDYTRLSTQFKLQWIPDAKSKMQPGYVLAPVTKPLTHLQLVQGDGWQKTVFGENWDRCQFQMNVADSAVVWGIRRLHVKLEYNYDKVIYKLRTANDTSSSQLGASDKGEGASDTYIVRFVTLTPAVWNILMGSSDNVGYCCGSVSDFDSYPGLAAACTNVGATKDSQKCKDSLGASCSVKGFKDKECQTWCAANPTICYPYLKEWCAKNPKDPACACFDTDGWKKWSDQMLPICNENPVCKQNISVFTPGCYYPACLASGLSAVSQNGTPCPNNVNTYNSCLNQVEVNSNGKIDAAGGIYMSCLQNTTNSNPTETTTNINVPRALPTVDNTLTPTIGGNQPPPSIDPNQPEEPREPPPEFEEDKTFIQKWWWVFLVAGIGVLLILGLVLWLVMSSGKKSPTQ